MSHVASVHVGLHAHASGRSADGGGVEAHIVQRQAHSRDHRGGEPLASLLRQARKVRREDRCRHERGHVLRICGALLQPAPGSGEPSLLQAPLRLPRPRKDSGREADELRSTVVGDRLDDLADPHDIALSSALDLEQPARTQRPRQARP